MFPALLTLNGQSFLMLLFRGQAAHGELGYGPNGKKSSANPEKLYALENVYTHQVCPHESRPRLILPASLHAHILHSLKVTVTHVGHTGGCGCGAHAVPGGPRE